MAKREAADLVLLDGIAQALAKVERLEEAIDIRDKARALEHYLARRDRAGLSAVRAENIRLRAERRAGELLPEKATPASAGKKGGKVSVAARRGSGSRAKPLPGAVTKAEAHRLRQLAALPAQAFDAALATAVKRGQASAAVKRLAQARKDAVREDRAAREAKAPRVELGQDVRLLHADMRTLSRAGPTPASVDAIVTDPPYPQDALPLYSDLGRLAARVLKPGASAFVMVGQSYLPDWMAQKVEAASESVRLEACFRGLVGEAAVRDFFGARYASIMAPPSNAADNRAVCDHDWRFIGPDLDVGVDAWGQGARGKWAWPRLKPRTDLHVLWRFDPDGIAIVHVECDEGIGVIGLQPGRSEPDELLWALDEFVGCDDGTRGMSMSERRAERMRRGEA